MPQDTVDAVHEQQVTDDRVLVVSSDGHATARMRDYRPYVAVAYRDEFDTFCDLHDKEGTLTTDAESLKNRLDPYVVVDWVDTVINPGRLGGQSNPHLRMKELDREGVAAELLFPDFGLPFELHSALKSALLGIERTPEQIEVANKAYNRWLADFCSESAGRLGGLATVSFVDVEDTVAEIHWAKEHGLVGIVLPTLDEAIPFFHPRHEPIWDVLEELRMPVASHVSISSVSKHSSYKSYMAVPHPTCAIPLMTAQVFFYTQQILAHLIWGGVLERHPGLQVALTEQGSGWVTSAIGGMDYSYEKSYLRRDVREVVKHKPSEYYERQIHMGSSLFSRAEAEARYEIGVHKICIGMDYPHHEGTWASGPGTTDWLRATLGAVGVPADEARLMLGQNAAHLWGFDIDTLRKVSQAIGPDIRTILSPAEAEYYPRGDVNKPLTLAF